MANQGKPPIVIETGPGCGLNTRQEGGSFHAQLVVKDSESESQILFMHEMAGNGNYHTELIDGGLDDAAVEQKFAECPCRQPDGVGKELGKSCLVISKLKIQEV